MVTSEAFQEATRFRADTEDRPTKAVIEDRAKSRAARRRTTENDAETTEVANVSTT